MLWWSHFIHAAPQKKKKKKKRGGGLLFGGNVLIKLLYVGLGVETNVHDNVLTIIELVTILRARAFFWIWSALVGQSKGVRDAIVLFSLPSWYGHGRTLLQANSFEVKFW